ncbi:putative mitochondrial Tob55 [Leptomonas pyrrhocoris]|uniref:Putative mitochondrial Tob55 n=1 Tax=Leptomonas pyrrhocoris TaxID=157538 RepID=A0A0M9G218_LEPPY|nr:putative mitochondrial Tob55 [Leptomonas pyrrhocoris]KPA80566.1 putative mitochondrial Tob55 [Leptomonas pyrrhocoris]|eukprot:XP_015659005.1 putative mitochondrial Tob55 [Leptomonas pyrrhocoris]
MAEVPAQPVNITKEEVEATLKVPIRAHVRLSGASNTHPLVVAKDLETIKRCGTMQEAVQTIIDVRSRWISMGIFRSVQYNFEPTKDGMENDVCVHIEVVEEKPKKSIGVFTTDTSIPEITVALENILGGRYSIKGNYIPPASRVHSISFSFLSNVPFIGQNAEYYIGRRTESKTYHLANAERIEEMKATTTNQKGKVASELSIGFQRRTLLSKHMKDIPAGDLPDFTATDKGYIRHQFTVTDVAHHANPFLYNMYPLPIYGSQVSLSSEFAGGLIGGEFSFIKNELQATKYVPLGPFFSLQLSCKLAGVYSFFGGRTPLNDRLFLSNCHVRGFKSVGPSTLDSGSPVSRFAATGGNALWATSASLNFPFLFFPDNGIAAMHLFANAGHLRMIDSMESMRDGYRWLRDCACSVGAGIVITRIPLFGVAPSGRFEVNISIPLGVDRDGNVVCRNGRKSLFDRFRFGLVWSSNMSF